MELFLLVDIVNKVNRLSDGELEVGVVETLGPTLDATASITGEFPLQYINLGIPRGVQGERGPRGFTGPAGEAPDLDAKVATAQVAATSAAASATSAAASAELAGAIALGDAESALLTMINNPESPVGSGLRELLAGTVAYAENASGVGTAMVEGSWTAIPGVQIVVPATDRDVWLIWSAWIGISTAGQGRISTAPWDFTDANIFVTPLPTGMAFSRCLTSSPISTYHDIQTQMLNVGPSDRDRVFVLNGLLVQEGSELAAYTKNGGEGYDHTWMAAVTL